MDINEFTKIEDSSRLALDNMIGHQIKNLCFDHGYVTHIYNSKFSIFSQNIVIDLGEKETVVLNDFYENQFYTQLHILHAFTRQKCNRPHHSLLYMEELLSKIKSINVWGFKNEKQFWDKDKIRLYQENGILDKNISTLNHSVSTQHIFEINLENKRSIILKSESKNSIELQVHKTNDEVNNWLNKDYFQWMTFGS